MSSIQEIRRCDSCGVERIGPGIGTVPGDRLPCANDECGSVGLSMSVEITDDVGLRDQIRGKVKDPALGSRDGRKLDFITGAEYFRRDQRWHRVDRVIDYVNDWYDELITDESAGVVVRECHEQLSEHRGRGSAHRSNQEG